MNCIGGGGDDSGAGAGGSKPSGSISLKLSKEAAYDPEKHCIFCLEASSTLFKLSGSDNGRTKIVQVILTSYYDYHQCMNIFQYCVVSLKSFLATRSWFHCIDVY